MRFLVFVVMLYIITSCSGDSSGTRLSSNQFDTEIVASSNWTSGEYPPPESFANQCINPRSNEDFQDLFGTYEDENNWIRSWSHKTYLWYKELPDIDPASIKNPEEYFQLMKTSAKTDTGREKDRFHYAQNTKDYIQYTQSGITPGYGFTYTLTQSTPPRKAIIIYTQMNSPASVKGMRRGTEIISVDGEPLLNGDLGIINAGLMPSTLGEEHTFVIKDLNSSTTRTVVLESSAIIEYPIHTSSVIQKPNSNKKIGYLVLNTFAAATAERQLVDIIEFFKKIAIDEVILDLRYNGGGYVAISAELGTMISGIEATNQIFTELTYNDKQINKNILIPFPTTTYGIAKSYGSGIQLPTLDLSRVYIIASRNTASASELLINGLRGIDFEVVLIGNSTVGKPYGWVPEDNCGTTYSTIQFMTANAKGFGDFSDGFVPASLNNETNQVRGCLVYEDVNHLLGDIDEKMLATAIHHIETGSCPSNSIHARNKSSDPLARTVGEIIRRNPIDSIVTKGLINNEY